MKTSGWTTTPALLTPVHYRAEEREDVAFEEKREKWAEDGECGFMQVGVVSWFQESSLPQNTNAFQITILTLLMHGLRVAPLPCAFHPLCLVLYVNGNAHWMVGGVEHELLVYTEYDLTLETRRYSDSQSNRVVEHKKKVFRGILYGAWQQGVERRMRKKK